jgi:hypothetical protein
MARKAPDRWRKRFGKPRYPIWQRLADRIAGIRDGKAGIPALHEAGNSALTPYHSILARQFDGAADHERLDMEIDTYTLRGQLNGLSSQIPEAKNEAESSSEQLRQLPATAPEELLKVRNAVELHLPEEVARTRRQREYDQKRTPIVTAESKAWRKLRQLQAERGRVAENIEKIRQIFATRARLHYDHAERRCHTYELHLLRRHPKRAELVTRLPLWRPQLPPWAQENRPDKGSADDEA